MAGVGPVMSKTEVANLLLYTHTREPERGRERGVVSAVARAAKRRPTIDERPAPWPVVAKAEERGGRAV